MCAAQPASIDCRGGNSMVRGYCMQFARMHATCLGSSRGGLLDIVGGVDES